jgi:putative dimethyl sulfoxide reductase chaperone
MMDSPAREDSQIQSRAASYGFLAWLFLEQPGPDFVIRLLSEEVQESLRSLKAGAPADSKIVAGLQEMIAYVTGDGSQSIEAICQALALERTRVLRGAGRHNAPPLPYESLYRSPDTGGEISVLEAVAKFYRSAEVEQSDRQVDQIDYLGLELDLMRLLCDEASSCRDQGDVEASNRFASLQKSFLQEHLLLWVPQYCELMLQYPSGGFYHGVVRLLLGFLEEEATILRGSPIEAREFAKGFLTGMGR